MTEKIQKTMETYDNQFRKKLVLNIGLIAIPAASIIGSILGFGAGRLDSSLEADKALLMAANRATQAIYQPVGNGGALAAMNGYISQERSQMYSNMEKVCNTIIGDTYKPYFPPDDNSTCLDRLENAMERISEDRF